MKRLLSFSLLLISFSLSAQIVSPVINADQSVTFTVYAPRAENVFVKGSFAEKVFQIRTKVGAFGRDKKYRMERNGDVWTFTTAPLSSEMYTYLFQIDDCDTIDVANTNVIRDVDKYYSYFVIPGSPGSFYLRQVVPHGEVLKVWYPSQLNNMKQRRMSLYLPAEYAQDPSRRYPVLYLLHGSGGDENAWLESGAASEIMDNMIAQGLSKPMIVVMPNGIESLDAAPGESPYMTATPSAFNVTSMLGKIESAFVPEVVRYVDDHYRTQADKDHRAIAGLSLGGLQTIYITANNPDSFAYVGLFSAQTTNMLRDEHITSVGKLSNRLAALKTIFSKDAKPAAPSLSEIAVYAEFDRKLKEQFARPPHLYYIAVGRDDFVKKLNDDFRMKLDSIGCTYTYNETDGAHTWSNWRRYLLDFLPKLF